MNSRIYKGLVRHRRFSPRTHNFTYKIFLLFLNLDEITNLFEKSPFWSTKNTSLARFKPSDFYFGNQGNIADNVRDYVFEHTGKRPAGPIFLLANIRYFGFVFNPICCYYCYNENGSSLEAIVAEVSNTPWQQKHPYVLNCNPESNSQKIVFQKNFHVSPFLPMDMEYHWFCRKPGRHLSLHLENHKNGEKIFDATLNLKSQPFTKTRMALILVEYPFMTIKIVAAIYWQALKLFLKRIPFYNHPQSILKHS